MQIPQIIHQSWKTTDIPFQIYPRLWHLSWKDFHPNWEFRLWTDEDNENLVRLEYPQYYDFYLSLDVGIKKADFCRFLYMHRYGGIYVDLDFVCLKNFTPLLYDADIVIGQLSKDNCHYTLPNALLASLPGLDFWLQLATDAMNAPPEEQGVEYHSGPFRLQWGIYKYQPANLRILDQHLVYPLDWINFTDWQEGRHYRPDLCELAWRLREMSIEEIAAIFPQSFALTTWNHNW